LHLLERQEGQNCTYQKDKRVKIALTIKTRGSKLHLPERQ